MRAASACLLGVPASAHMSLVVPPSRNGADRVLPQWQGAGTWWPYQQNCSNPHPEPHGGVPSGCIPTGTDGYGCNCANGTSGRTPDGTCSVGQSCFWFSQGCTIGCGACDGGACNPNTNDRCGNGMKATVNDPKYRTYNRGAVAGSAQDIYKHNPWRAPGSAPVYDPCGAAGGGPNSDEGGKAKYITTKFAKQGDLGSKVLPPAPTGIVWKAGGLATAKWSIRANHGGGYQYRICPFESELTERCFQQVPLAFATTRHFLEFGADVGGGSTYINATIVSDGTFPPGSMWAMNPFPYSNKDNEPEFEPPCPETVDRTKFDTGRCSGRNPYSSLISDILNVPKVAPGKYVLQLRWDCEKSAQVWANCADIEIV